MECRWETSDASYDARISLDDMPNDHWDKLEDNALSLDPDYLNMLRSLTGHPAKHKPRFTNQRYTIEQQLVVLFGKDSYEGNLGDGGTFSGTCEGQQYKTGTINDLQKDDDEVVQERVDNLGERTKGTETLSDLVEGDMDVEIDNEKNENKRKLGESDMGNLVALVLNDTEINKRKSLKASDRRKIVKLQKENQGRKRRFIELNEGNSAAHLENELEQFLRSLSEVERDGMNNNLEMEFERFLRDSKEIKRIKDKVVEYENSIKEKAKQLMSILKYHSKTAHIQQGSDSLAVQVGENNVDENVKLSNNMDVGCLVQTAKITDIIKTEQSPYVPDGDVEVLDHAEIVEQGIQTTFVLTNGDFFCESIEFRRELMNALTKPFNKEEYESLSKLFKEGSYRHSFPAVGKKLSKNRYKRKKRMNILRGFFFWLKNMTQEGSFRPWEDRQCLAI